LLGDIHADDSEIVDILAQLVTKCLVVALDVGGSEPSYRLLNTTRAYARKKLIEAESDLILRCRDEELSVIPALYFQADTA
jgi:predicted ATPase